MGKRGGEEEREEKEKKKKKRRERIKLYIYIYIFFFYNFETTIKCQSQRCLVHALKQQFSIFSKIRVGEKIYKNTCNII